MDQRRVRERVAGWRRASAAVREDRARSLALLTSAEARAIAEDLVALADELPPKSGSSGLIEQQQLFDTLRG